MEFSWNFLSLPTKPAMAGSVSCNDFQIDWTFGTTPLGAFYKQRKGKNRWETMLCFLFFFFPFLLSFFLLPRFPSFLSIHSSFFPSSSSSSFFLALPPPSSCVVPSFFFVPSSLSYLPLASSFIRVSSSPFFFLLLPWWQLRFRALGWENRLQVQMQMQEQRQASYHLEKTAKELFPLVKKEWTSLILAAPSTLSSPRTPREALVAKKNGNDESPWRHHDESKVVLGAV